MKRPSVQLTCCPLMYGCMSPHFCCCRTWGKYLMQYWLFSFSLNIYFVLLFPKLCKTALIGRGGWFFFSLFSLFFLVVYLFWGCLFVYLLGYFWIFFCLIPSLRCFRLIGDLAGGAQNLTGFVSNSHMIENWRMLVWLGDKRNVCCVQGRCVLQDTLFHQWAELP